MRKRTVSYITVANFTVSSNSAFAYCFYQCNLALRFIELNPTQKRQVTNRRILCHINGTIYKHTKGLFTSNESGKKNKEEMKKCSKKVITEQ